MAKIICGCCGGITSVGEPIIGEDIDPTQKYLDVEVYAAVEGCPNGSAVSLGEDLDDICVYGAVSDIWLIDDAQEDLLDSVAEGMYMSQSNVFGINPPWVILSEGEKRIYRLEALRALTPDWDDSDF